MEVRQRQHGVFRHSPVGCGQERKAAPRLRRIITFRSMFPEVDHVRLCECRLCNGKKNGPPDLLLPLADAGDPDERKPSNGISNIIGKKVRTAIALTLTAKPIFAAFWKNGIRLPWNLRPIVVALSIQQKW